MDYSVVSIGLLLVALLFLSRYFRYGLPFPPGPIGLPVLGVLKELPKVESWKTYAEWGRIHGNKGIISFHVMGKRIVVINSAETANELLNRRSLVYSDRPITQMLKLMKRENSIFFIPYNGRLKIYRTLMQQSFNISAINSYNSILEHEAHVLVQNLLRSPSNLAEHTKRNAGAVTMKIAYGYTIDKDNDYFVRLAEEAQMIAALATAPGKWLVEAIPLLKYLPDWLPGAAFKRQAREWAKLQYAQSQEPLEYVKSQMAAGTAIPSLTSQLLSHRDSKISDSEYDDIVFFTTSAIYAAGADTTASAMETFILLMVLYPDIQRRAQEEVDQLVNREHRLPIIQDRPSMPYLESLLKEVLRWYPPAPLGVYHRTSSDDIYAGYQIPAKTPVIANIWAMTHAEETYPDPFTFDPDRFTGARDAPQRDPFDFVFGFGRRVCPGLHVAVSSMFIQMATILSVVDVSKAVDATGRIIEPEVAFTTSIVSHVQPFKYRATPRSAQTSAMIEQAITSED